MEDRLLKRPEVEAITGLSRAAIYARMKKDTFPLPVRLGSNSVAWRASEIQRWIADLRKAVDLRHHDAPPDLNDSRAAAG